MLAKKYIKLANDIANEIYPSGADIPEDAIEKFELDYVGAGSTRTVYSDAYNKVVFKVGVPKINLTEKYIFDNLLPKKYKRYYAPVLYVTRCGGVSVMPYYPQSCEEFAPESYEEKRLDRFVYFLYKNLPSALTFDLSEFNIRKTAKNKFKVVDYEPFATFLNDYGEFVEPEWTRFQQAMNQKRYI